MDDFAKLPETDQAVVFAETASRTGIRAPYIAKDFWVCWTLEKLFALPDIGSHLIFKGGTSLSKVYGIIERFSEDIDVSLSRQWLGFSGAHDPENAPSGKKEKQWLEELSAACAVKIRDGLFPSLHSRIASVLGETERPWKLEIDAADPQTVRFYYPGHPDPVAEPGATLPYIKIELGARSDDWPAEIHPVTPYAAEHVPQAFGRLRCDVRALAMERTFWEKATLLHAEHHRPTESPLPKRLSRHMYDLVRYAVTGKAEVALARHDLRERVVDHKSVFFRSAWAHYETAVPGHFHLLPPHHRQGEWQRDYEQMGDMIFGEAPAFDVILAMLLKLEQQINLTRNDDSNG